MTIFFRLVGTVFVIGMTWAALDLANSLFNYPNTLAVLASAVLLIFQFFVTGWAMKTLWPLSLFTGKKDQ